MRGEKPEEKEKREKCRGGKKIEKKVKEEI